MRKTRRGLKTSAETRAAVEKTFHGDWDTSMVKKEESRLRPHSRSSVAAHQILHDAFEELFAEFGPFPVTRGQHGLEHCAGNGIRHTYCNGGTAGEKNTC